jgi:trans-aconitate 2-methyltransferase
VDDTRWDPSRYLAFADHRQRPALELLARVPLSSPTLVYDLGCGTGSATRAVSGRWPEARVIGVDSSTEMLERAAATPSRIEWLAADVRSWEPSQPAHLIYSNAALHWVGDHDALFPRLLARLAPGGCLAVQMPLSWDLPSHHAIRETLATGGPGGSSLGSAELRREMERRWVDEHDVYYDRLAPHTTALDIWETRYLQVMEGDDPVLEWVSSTSLRPVLHGLTDRDRELFLAGYSRRLRDAYPRRHDGRTVYPFRRLFLVAVV